MSETQIVDATISKSSPERDSAIPTHQNDVGRVQEEDSNLLIIGKQDLKSEVVCQELKSNGQVCGREIIPHAEVCEVHQKLRDNIQKLAGNLPVQEHVSEIKSFKSYKLKNGETWKNDDDWKKVPTSQVARILEEGDEGWNIRVKPDSRGGIWGDIDQNKDGSSISDINDFRESFLQNLKNLDIDVHRENLHFTINKEKKGSFHFNIPAKDLKGTVRTTTVRLLIENFKKNFPKLSPFLDTSIYPTQNAKVFRLPYQTCKNREGILKTKHVPLVDGDDLNNFIFDLFTDDLPEIDSKFLVALSCAEMNKKKNEESDSPKVKNKAVIEDEEEVGEDEKEPDLLPPNEEEQGIDEIDIPITEEEEEEIQPELDEDEKKSIEQTAELNLIKELLDKCYPPECFYDRGQWLDDIVIPLKHSFGKKGYEVLDSVSKKCPEKYDSIENKRIWDSIGKHDNPKGIGSLYRMAEKYNRSEYLRITRASKLCSRKKLREIYENIDPLELKDFKEVLNELKESFYQTVNSPKTYKAFKNKCVWILNNYLCWIEGNEKGYILHREVIEEDIPNLNGEIVHCPIPIYLAKASGNFQADVGMYSIPDAVWLDKKTGKVQFSEKPKSILDVWLSSIERRTKRKETFIQKGRDCFPVFNHCAITRELAKKHAGDFSKIQHYLDFQKIKICGNNEPLFDYFIDYQAYLIQYIAVKMGVALVMKGLEGIGKGIFVQLLADIIGRVFFLQPSGVDELFGNFNSLMDNKILVFLDELVWGGDKQKSGVIKKLLTEEKRTSNIKFGAQRVVENNFNGIIASNEEWVIPAGQNARRFVMTEVGDWLTNQPQEVVDELRNVDRFTYAHYLYSRDLSKFNPRTIVLTDALLAQKLLSADPFMDYVISIVQNNFTFEREEMDIGLNRLIKKDIQLTGIKVGELYKDYKKNTSHPIPQTLFTKKWNNLFPNNKPTYKRACDSTHKIWINFPSMKDCKAIFKKEFRQPVFSEELGEEDPSKDCKVNVIPDEIIHEINGNGEETVENTIKDVVNNL